MDSAKKQPHNLNKRYEYKQMVWMTLNIRNDMPSEKWEIIDQIYKAMPGWKGYIDDGCPVWELGDGKHVSASVEPSGLIIEGEATQASFDKWIAEFVSNASEQLGFTVSDAEA